MHMDTLQSALKLMKPNCFKAFGKAPVSQSSRNILRLCTSRSIIQYTCSSKGLAYIYKYLNWFVRTSQIRKFLSRLLLTTFTLKRVSEVTYSMM